MRPEKEIVPKPPDHALARRTSCQCSPASCCCDHYGRAYLDTGRYGRARYTYTDQQAE
jgi:hypothetical protein